MNVVSQKLQLLRQRVKELAAPEPYVPLSDEELRTFAPLAGISDLAAQRMPLVRSRR